MSQAPEDVTGMLIRWSEGDQEALGRLMPVVYDELHHIAERYFRRERFDSLLQPTALVNEAYLRLVNQSGIDWRNRAQFFGIAATTMRRILVERARARNATKRGSGNFELDLTDVKRRGLMRTSWISWRSTERWKNLRHSTLNNAESSKPSSSAGFPLKRQRK